MVWDHTVWDGSRIKVPLLLEAQRVCASANPQGIGTVQRMRGSDSTRVRFQVWSSPAEVTARAHSNRLCMMNQEVRGTQKPIPALPLLHCAMH